MQQVSVEICMLAFPKGVAFLLEFTIDESNFSTTRKQHNFLSTTKILQPECSVSNFER